jgi:hypothetical protein
MNESTLTLGLGGNVPLEHFAQTVARFHQLVTHLTEEVSGDAAIAWIVDELQAGSAIITIRGEAEQPEAVSRVVRAYAVVGESLEQHLPIPYSPQVAHAAESLTKVLNGQVTSLHFEAGGEVATVTATVPTDQTVGLLSAFGSIEGRIETLSSRRGLTFTLFDARDDRAIRCYLKPDRADTVRDAWAHRAIVQGWVRRDPTSGRPVSINPVDSIEVLPEVEPGSYRRARGIAPARVDAPTISDAIRRLRDA